MRTHAPLAQLRPLHDAPLRMVCTVERVSAPEHAPEWARWLAEIGFIAGEQVCVMARALPGGDPLVVRAGSSTFALRRAEAACVHIWLPGEVASA
jgi:ferrous iron transport protein A